jgi:hypothetical protein
MGNIRTGGIAVLLLFLGFLGLPVRFVRLVLHDCDGCFGLKTSSRKKISLSHDEYLRVNPKILGLSLIDKAYLITRVWGCSSG